MSAGRQTHAAAVAWHDCECGSYAADLELWVRLAAESGGPVLDLGAGTGRVALHLARAGREVTAVDRDPALVAALESRASRQGVAVVAAVADARALALGGRFALVIAPMQLAQIVGGPAERAALIRSAADHLAPGGRVALALLADERVTEPGEGPPLPDLLERDGRVYSSLPVEVRDAGDALELRRLRQVVSPTGELEEGLDVMRLARLAPEALEAEAAAAGLRPAARIPIPASADHVGSTVVVLERR